MTAQQLIGLVSSVKMEPGIKMIIDPVAAKIIGRSRIRTIILGRREVKRLPKILEGESHSGTTVLPR
jgi:uridylate kinase